MAAGPKGGASKSNALAKPELDKLQVLRLRRGPLDRRLGMATLWLDTAGAGAFAPPLRIRFLPLDAAQARK